jgi:hypothetical protein
MLIYAALVAESTLALAGFKVNVPLLGKVCRTWAVGRFEMKAIFGER